MSIAIPAGVFMPIPRARPASTVPVTLYGSWWGLASFRARRHLVRLGIPFRWVDIMIHPESARMIPVAVVGSDAAWPVVRIDEEWLSAPSLELLDQVLHEHGLLN